MVKITDSMPGRTVVCDGREMLFFSGFSYLGMHTSPVFRQLLAEGQERFGSVYPSSRIGNLQLRLYEELEHALAVHTGQQAAACFSSGYLSAQAAVTYAVTRGTPLYAPGAHPALRYPGAAVTSGNWEAWLDTTVDMLNREPDHTYVLISDAVDPLRGEVHDFSALARLERKALVLIDDSHGIGVLGARGEGISGMLPASENAHYLITASLAKAYSLEGGLVAGHAADIAAIRRLPLFTASTPIIPANAYAWLKAEHAFSEARKLLRGNITALERLTGPIDELPHPYELPMFVLEDPSEAVYSWLLSRDSLISSFAYPDPQGDRINRIILSALHTPDDLEMIAAQLVQYYSHT
ncbi:aminotransferase class I/II-fold pyridoxal phosphate-dependent enzyme [Chitinophaga sp. NPDC101104]|uniref:aminotransferase class I/II-fold pyridoxal phosphate-dependent enzyme n=1 Tax=Chitinophaga sp. NPDC101104 TaxID=3390561 RepID=UPI003CFF1A29